MRTALLVRFSCNEAWTEKSAHQVRRERADTYGGAVLVHQFLQRIGFRGQLAQSVRFRQRNNRYQISETVLAVLYPVILGMERLGFTESLRHNGVFQYLTGLPGYPDATGLRRFLWRFSRAGRMGFLKLHDGTVE